MAEKIGSIYYDLDLRDNQFNSKLHQADKNTKNFGDNVNKVAGAFVALGAAAALALKQTASFLMDAANASSQYETSMTSITRIGAALGLSMDKVKSAAKSLTKDGLLTVTDAAAGLNNLLRSGFSLPESIKLMENFKNTASFGGQAGLTFGRRIVSATEGIKNGNSILVDNAGVTKNLSRILQEAGFAEDDLMKVKEDAAVRQAMYNGLLAEGAVNLGDAAAYAETYAGKQTILNNQIFEAKAALGDVFKPILRDVLERLLKIVKAIKAWIEENPNLVKIIAGAVVAILGLFVAFGLLAGAVLIFNLVGGTALLIIGGLVLAIGLIIGFIGLFIFGLVQLYNKNKWFHDFVDMIWQNIKKIIKEAWEQHIRPALSQIKESFDRLVQTIKDLLEKHPELKEMLKFQAILIGIAILGSLKYSLWWVEMALKAVSLQLDYLNNLMVAGSNIVSAFKSAWEGAVRGVLAVVLQLMKQLNKLPSGVKKFLKLEGLDTGISALDSYLNGGGSTWGRTGANFGGPDAPLENYGSRRAMGGYQKGGELGLVGEQGPELFVPDSPGHILDAQRTAAMLSNSSLLGLGNILSKSMSSAGRQSSTVHLYVDVDGVTAMSRPQAKAFGSYLIEAVNDDLKKRGVELIGDGKIKGTG